MTAPHLTKTCRKCGTAFPATTEFFYKNSGGKFGLTPRCKPCVDQDNKDSHQKRLASDPERVRALASARTKRYYQRNLGERREAHRQYQARQRQDPEKLARIQARKRAAGAGLSPEQIQEIFEAQGCVCAICGSTEPHAKNGWNLDHCHKTGAVRFILCAHCNRGLGAFRDQPDLMRKAASVLESFYQNAADHPQEAILEK